MLTRSDHFFCKWCLINGSQSHKKASNRWAKKKGVCLFHLYAKVPRSASQRTLSSPGSTYSTIKDRALMTLDMPSDFVYQRGCSPHNRLLHAHHILMSFRQNTLNVRTHYTISVYYVFTKKKVGKAEMIYALLPTDSDSIISLNFGNCYLSWFHADSHTAGNALRRQSPSLKCHRSNSLPCKWERRTSI